MRKLLLLLAFLICSVSGYAQTRLTLRLTITNSTAAVLSNSTLTVNGSTRTWVTNSVSNTQLQITNSTVNAASVVYANAAAKSFGTGISLQLFTNTVIFSGATGVSITTNGDTRGYAILTITTNTVTADSGQPVLVASNTVVLAGIYTNLFLNNPTAFQAAGALAGYGGSAVTNGLAKLTDLANTNTAIRTGSQAVTNGLPDTTAVITDINLSNAAIRVGSQAVTNGLPDLAKLIATSNTLALASNPTNQNFGGGVNVYSAESNSVHLFKTITSGDSSRFTFTGNASNVVGIASPSLFLQGDSGRFLNDLTLNGQLFIDANSAAGASLIVYNSSINNGFTISPNSGAASITAINPGLSLDFSNFTAGVTLNGSPLLTMASGGPTNLATILASGPNPGNMASEVISNGTLTNITLQAVIIQGNLTATNNANLAGNGIATNGDTRTQSLPNTTAGSATWSANGATASNIAVTASNLAASALQNMVYDATYFVATNGSDTASGSRVTPFATVFRAVAQTFSNSVTLYTVPNYLYTFSGSLAKVASLTGFAFTINGVTGNWTTNFPTPTNGILIPSNAPPSKAAAITNLWQFLNTNNVLPGATFALAPGNSGTFSITAPTNTIYSYGLEYTNYAALFINTNAAIVYPSVRINIGVGTFNEGNVTLNPNNASPLSIVGAGMNLTTINGRPTGPANFLKLYPTNYLSEFSVVVPSFTNVTPINMTGPIIARHITTYGGYDGFAGTSFGTNYLEDVTTHSCFDSWVVIGGYTFGWNLNFNSVGPFTTGNPATALQVGIGSTFEAWSSRFYASLGSNATFAAQSTNGGWIIEHDCSMIASNDLGTIRPASIIATSGSTITLDGGSVALPAMVTNGGGAFVAIAPIYTNSPTIGTIGYSDGNFGYWAAPGQSNRALLTNSITTVPGSFALPATNGFASISLSVTVGASTEPNFDLFEVNGFATNPIDEFQGLPLSATSIITLKGRTTSGYTLIITNGNGLGVGGSVSVNTDGGTAIHPNRITFP